MVIMTGGHSTLSDDDALYRHPMPKIISTTLHDPNSGKTRLSIVCLATTFGDTLRRKLVNIAGVDPFTPIGDINMSNAHIVVLDLTSDAPPDSVALDVIKAIATHCRWDVYDDNLASV